jgi:pimeloyl-ACP methyl ester carboxylesterase
VSDARFVEIEHDGRLISLEYAWLAPKRNVRDATPGNAFARSKRREAPLVVFLHEGLGSVAMWKDYPQRLCAAGGYRGLVLSREGYGRSTPRAPGTRWPVDFMHRHARDVLPRVFARLAVGVDGDVPWLFGHSDGGSIALIYAAMFPRAVAGLVVVAPHIFVEDVAIRSIEAARQAYRSTDLRARLARYHDDPDSAFFGWNDVWLDPAFRTFSIEGLLARIECPILAVQGENDEYGTLAQIAGIRERAPHAELVVLPQCGHSPHRDQPDALTSAVTAFIARHVERALNQGEV